MSVVPATRRGQVRAHVQAAALALALFNTITIERVVLSDGGYDRLYGFPLGWAPGSYYTSMAYDVFVLELLFDLAVYLIAAYGIVRWLRWLAGPGRRAGAVIRSVSLLIIFLAGGWMTLSHFEGNVYTRNNLTYRLVGWNLSIGLH